MYGSKKAGQINAGEMEPAGRKVDKYSTGDESEESLEETYSVWNEIDDVRSNLFIGGWATRRIREINTSRKRRYRDEIEKKRQAEQEGREYKSPLQMELEEAARKREEKERLKEEKRRHKETGRRG